MKQHCILVSVILLFSCSNILCAEKAYTIMEKHFNRKSAQTSIKQVSLLLIDRNKKKLRRTFIEKSRSTGGEESTYIEVTAPSNIAGVRFLSLSNDGHDEQRLYLPALQKAKRISGSGSSGKGGRFLGSDICYYDIEAKEIDDAAYTYVRQEEEGGELFHVIDAVPTADDCPYGKMRFWVRADNYIIYRTDAYDTKNGKKIKEMRVRSVVMNSGVDFVEEMIITDLEREHTTLYKLHSLETDTAIPASVFTLRHLER